MYLSTALPNRMNLLKSSDSGDFIPWVNDCRCFTLGPHKNNIDEIRRRWHRTHFLKVVDRHGYCCFLGVCNSVLSSFPVDSCIMLNSRECETLMRKRNVSFLLSGLLRFFILVFGPMRSWYERDFFAILLRWLCDKLFCPSPFSEMKMLSGLIDDV